MAELLAQKGIRTVEDLVLHIPLRYLDRRRLQAVSDLTPGADRTTVGRIVTAGMAFLGRKRRRIFEIALTDQRAVISLKWFRFHPRAMMAGFKKGMGLLVSGPVSLYRGEMQMIHPTVQVIDVDLVDEVEAPGIVPVYSQIPGLGQKAFRRIAHEALEGETVDWTDPLPEEIRQRHRLPERRQAMREIHFPPPTLEWKNLSDRQTEGYRREIFQEFFFMELALALRRGEIRHQRGVPVPMAREERESWMGRLPFTLTNAQRRVLEEIFKDLQGVRPMNRLLQGDVGSGKTVVALLSAIAVARSGHQTAIMVPTEILASQHYETARRFLKAFEIPVALLTSSLSPSERRQVLERVGEGTDQIVVGTHALISEGVRYRSLSLAIVDEQHRFGVLQRARLKAKGRSPHLLVMTATPIPRTLAMSLYGDLDLSVIDEMPPGRVPVRTEVLRNRRLLYQRMADHLGEGGQGYVVYPLVEESEKIPLKDATRMAEELRRSFPEYPVALLHGRTDLAERDQVLRRFREGEVRILVCTTVVEVGLDVPAATLMVVEHADRFGLSQLHQLRGRVGRGHRQGLCLLVADSRVTDEAYRRLNAMRESHDGFQVAEHDLALRGPGDFLGTRQSGLPELRLADLIRDASLLAQAREEAFRLVETDPGLTHFPLLRQQLTSAWKGRLGLAEVG